MADAVSGVYERGLQEMAGIGVKLMTAAECPAWLGSAYPGEPHWLSGENDWGRGCSGPGR